MSSYAAPFTFWKQCSVDRKKINIICSELHRIMQQNVCKTEHVCVTFEPNWINLLYYILKYDLRNMWVPLKSMQKLILPF
jgi:hypothetical protein